MGNIEDFDLDFGGIPLNMDELKENFNTLKEAFPEIYFNYGCDYCTKEVRNKREGYCKNCMIWQESPSLGNSKQECREFGVFALNDKKLGTSYFRHLTTELDITDLICGEDYLIKIPVYLEDGEDFNAYNNVNRVIQKLKLAGKEVVDIPKIILLRELDFGMSGEIIFTPKESIQRKMIPYSMWEVLKHYTVWRKIPKVITTHTKHGQKYIGKNIYIKLEPIK